MDFYSFGMPGRLSLLLPIQQFILFLIISPFDSVCGSGAIKCTANNENSPKRRKL